MERVERIKALLSQKTAIDAELAALREQVRAEKAAFTAGRKPRKQKGNSSE
jgi:hypothetical protein